MTNSNWCIKIVGLICYVILIACNDENKAEKSIKNVNIEVQERKCGDSNLCIQATFQLNKFYKKEKALLDRMDKDMRTCFTYQYEGVQVMPQAAERVETGHLDKITFMLYFSGIKKTRTAQKIIYRDIFFDLQEQNFRID